MSLAEFKDLCLDATNPEAVGAAQTVWINGVPEAKATKNRLLLDVHGTTVKSLQDLGAPVIDGDSFPWVVMAA